MYLKRYGTGPDTYFGLHGWSGDHRMFAPLARRLPASATLWSADLPGCGQTPPPRSWNIEAITDEIVAEVAALEAEKVTLIGYCSGANLALFAAQRLPERIKRLILIDTFAYMPLYFRVFLNPYFGRYAYLTTFANPLGRWLTNLSLREHRAQKSDLTNAFSDINHDVTYRYLSLLGSLADITQFRSLTMPVDLIYGANTFAAVKDSARQWQEIWPRARVHELAGAGHLPLQEAPKAFCAAVFPPAQTPEPALPERLQAYLTAQQTAIEAALQSALPLSTQPGAERLNEALRYALLPGGKRLRPVITMLGAQLAGLDHAPGLALGCAVEFLHSSSLILDDLPCMDDAGLRRNRRALHLEFGEGVAVLTALALLNQAYALLLQAARPGCAGKLITAATGCIGSNGMIGGQFLDLASHAGTAPAASWTERNLKTSALMRLALQAGALACGADESGLTKFGDCLGQAYQICDDLLDDTADGKPARQDARHQRANAVAELGPAEARRQAAALIAEGQQALQSRFGNRVEAQLLGDIAAFVLGRVPPGTM